MTTPVDPSLPVAPVQPPAAPAQPAATGLTQQEVWAMVEAARTEERTRLSELQTQFQATQDQLKVFQDEREARLTAEQAEAARLAEEQRQADQEKLTLKQRFEQSEAEWKNRFEQSEQQWKEELGRRDALLEKEREYGELVNYRAAKIQERSEPDPENGHYGIHPQFLDLIAGNTTAEIDASIATMENKTRAIVEEVSQHQISSRAAMPGVSPAGGNVGPLEQQGGQRTFSADEIRALPFDSPEYQALRQQHGMARGNASHGMFG